MAMKPLGRRGLLKLMGVGAAAAPLAGAARVAGGIPGVAFGTAAGELGMGFYPRPQATSFPAGPRALLLKAARKLFDSTAHEVAERACWRIGGFDHDIYALRSVPLATKVRMQRERDEEPKTLLERLHREAWPED